MLITMLRIWLGGLGAWLQKILKMNIITLYLAYLWLLASITASSHEKERKKSRINEMKYSIHIIDFSVCTETNANMRDKERKFQRFVTSHKYIAQTGRRTHRDKAFSMYSSCGNIFGNKKLQFIGNDSVPTNSELVQWLTKVMQYPTTQEK